MGAFWTFVVVVIAAVAFFQLGALSVWVGILRFGLLIVTLVICALVIIGIWRKLTS